MQAFFVDEEVRVVYKLCLIVYCVVQDFHHDLLVVEGLSVSEDVLDDYFCSRSELLSGVEASL